MGPPLGTATRGRHPILQFKVLGGFGLRCGHAWVAPSEWGRPMAVRLVRFLLARRGRVVPEDELFEAFWSEGDPLAARRCLAVSLSRARAVVGTDAIEVADRAYRLTLRHGDLVDADRFERACEAALAGSARDRLERAAALWTGEPLPEDRYADWAAPWRDRLTDRYRELLAALGDARARDRDHAGALRAASSMLELDPLDEGAHRRIMSAYAALGRRSRALEQYLRCRTALVEAAGIEPSAETARLHARILAGAEGTVAAA
jgi:DNA-binding SARP family transcriptional activator